MDPRARIVEALEARPEIVFAVLFGSRASGRARPDSDWDLAVFLDESLDASARFRVRRELAAALEPELDLLVARLRTARRRRAADPHDVALLERVVIVVPDVRR